MKKTIFALKQRFSLQKGISLLEVMLSLSIIVIILIMAMRYFITAKDSVLMNDSVARVGILAGASEEYKHATGALPTGISQISWAYTGFSNGTDPVTGWSTLISINGTHLTSTMNNNAQCQRLAAAFANASCTDATFNYDLSA